MDLFDLDPSGSYEDSSVSLSSNANQAKGNDKLVFIFIFLRVS